MGAANWRGPARDILARCETCPSTAGQGHPGRPDELQATRGALRYAPPLPCPPWRNCAPAPGG